MKRMRNTLVLAKIQTAKGTPATMTAAANAILCRAATPSIIDGDFVERPLIRGALGNYGKDIAGVHRTFELEVELAGSGTAGTAPGYGPLLIGCGLAETVTAATSVEYDPVSTGMQFITLEGYLDGVKFRMTDCQGTFSLEMNAKNYPILKFTFYGTYETLTDTPNPTGATFAAQAKPQVVGKINTATFTLAGNALCVESFSMDAANEVSWRELINCAGVSLSDRKPVGNLVAELPSVATINWGENVRLGQEMALVISHGLVAGNIVGITAPKLQINAKPTISDAQGVAMINAGFDVKPDAGNDDFKLSFT